MSKHRVNNRGRTEENTQIERWGFEAPEKKEEQFDASMKRNEDINKRKMWSTIQQQQQQRNTQGCEKSWFDANKKET